MKSRGLYNVTFVPQEKVSHYINITFNEEDVPGSPFKVEVTEAKPIEQHDKRISGGLVGSLNILEIDSNVSEGKLDVTVTGPQQTVLQSSISRNTEGKIKVEYLAKEVGMHKVEIINNGLPIFKKPLLKFVIQVELKL
jgi:filamin